MVFGLTIYMQLNRLPVHRAMREISELIYATCKTYLITQIKFILVLEVLIGTVMGIYFGVLRHQSAATVAAILFCSLLGIAGSSEVAWFGMRINTFANSRTAFASLKGKPFPTYAIPLKAGMSIGTVLISIELFVMLTILLFVSPENAGACFIGFAIGESLGASALRIAGGIFTKIADIGRALALAPRVVSLERGVDLEAAEARVVEEPRRRDLVVGGLAPRAREVRVGLERRARLVRSAGARGHGASPDARDQTTSDSSTAIRPAKEDMIASRSAGSSNGSPRKRSTAARVIRQRAGAETRA
jgi:inorganic H+ pyrophosphatase